MIYGNENLDLHAVIDDNTLRCHHTFERVKHEGAQWLVECRDLADRFDADAGVYFVPLDTIEEVDALVARYTPDNEWNRILGIYTPCVALDAQNHGLSRAQWIQHRAHIQSPEDILELCSAPQIPPDIIPPDIQRPPMSLSSIESFAIVLLGCAILWLCLTAFC